MELDELYSQAAGADKVWRFQEYLQILEVLFEHWPFH
jgi:hypothetical protein